ncbi:MAG: Mrp/NBP35 family ATP-binding protein [Candidatus Tectomicrobia bacterium]|nr:Mrp/NBP35 family ATP-binding protein [Candidatus Tectomicrobia bacterium]
MPKKYSDIVGDGGSNIIGQVMEQAARLKARLSQVKHTIAVMSGKGGVGKSAITVNLAAALALQGYQVGVVDADINGPSIAKMMGVKGQDLKVDEGGVYPAIGPLKLKVMSMDLLLASDETPVIWDGPSQETFVWRATMEATTLREFLTDTEWGELDFLLVDLPPGTDKFMNVTEVLPRFSGTIVVTIPSEVSQLVVKKSITLAKKLKKSPILGVIENMRGYFCVECGTIGELFHEGDTEAMASQLGVPFLGQIPFDPRLSVSTDRGKPFVIDYPDAPAAQTVIEIAKKVVAHCTSSPV